ncbi:MAG: hypothetical protein ACOC7S_00930 [Planctomycetota bacterium]
MDSLLEPEVLDLLLKVAVAAVAAVWALPAVRRWRQDVKQGLLAEAYEFVKMGVATTYESYVRHKKEMAADGKLTDQERREARKRAKRVAVLAIRQKLPDTVQSTVDNLLDLWIEEAVDERKAAAKGGH